MMQTLREKVYKSKNDKDFLHNEVLKSTMNQKFIS